MQLNSELLLLPLTGVNNNNNGRKVRINNALIKHRHTKTSCVVMQPLGCILSYYCFFTKVDNSTVMSHQETKIGVNMKTPSWYHYSRIDH